VKVFARYLGIGVVATLAHWAAMALLVEAAGVVPWLASGCGAVLGAQIAFFGNRRYTFEHRAPVGPAWWRFMGTALLGAGVGMGVVAAAAALGWHYLLAQALATALVVLLTFAINRAWTFAR